MELKQKNVILMIADISGYTKFMLAHEKSLTHSQLIIGELMNAILEQVELPLTVAKLEGDAIFLYALKEESTWDSLRQALSAKLVVFFNAFSHKLGELEASNICRCEACQNLDKLKLKVIAHSGKAVLYRVGSLTELSGVDVIVAHRLLKNSIKSSEYIMLTAAAHQDIAWQNAPMTTSVETYDDIGAVNVFVYEPPAPVPYVPDPHNPSPVTSIFLESLRSEIRREYEQVAVSPEKGFHFHTGRPLAQRLGYRDEWLQGIPEPTIASLAGTGNPFSIGALQTGEHVVDVGCGAGLDSLIAARMVGPTGKVVGVDMTPSMLEKATQSARELGLTHVEFREGFAEALPVPDGWADVVISNGVLNLTPDKATTLQEMARVLKPQGRLQIGDILVQTAVPPEAKKDIDLWAG
jgi:2-polyprenyl-3-methyl-5-hydroxy-6-metoxy-1,4-benzoquinol methylase